MPTGKTGSFTLWGTNYCSGRFTYTESYDVEKNTSTLTVKLEVASTAWNTTYTLKGKITAGGVTVRNFDSSAGSVYTTADGAYHTAGTWTSGAIPHNADGSKSVSVSVSVTGSASGVPTWYMNGSKSVALTDIPRASDIGAADANIGSASIIAVGRKSDAYTHSIAYKFGSLSGYVTAAGGVSSSEVKFAATSVPFTVPTAFYAQIPNAKSGTCTLTCKTYSGGTQIGSAQTCAFTATAAESACAPSVSGTVTDSNAATKALTGDANKLVRYASTALCTVTATAKNSASIKTKTVNGQTPNSSNQLSVANVETGSFVFSAKDSRGYTVTKTVTKTVVEYIKPTCNASIKRTAPTADTATLTLSGNYFNASFGAKSNSLTVTYKADSGSAVTVTAKKSGNTWSASATVSGLSYTAAHTVTVTAKDALNTVTTTVTVPRGVPVFDWGQNDFQMNVPFNARGNVVLGPDSHLQFQRKYSGGTRTDEVMRVYPGDANGSGVVIGAGGRTIVGGGESASNLRTALGTAAADETAEQMHVANDGTVLIHTNCQTVANRKTYTYGTDGRQTGPFGAFAQWKLLWTNPSPTSGFAAKTLAVSGLSGYELFFVNCAYGAVTDHDYTGYGFVYVPDTDSSRILTVAVPDYGAATIRCVTRTFRFRRAANQVEIGIGVRHGVDSGTEGESYAVPLYILGAKL